MFQQAEREEQARRMKERSQLQQQRIQQLQTQRAKLFQQQQQAARQLAEAGLQNLYEEVSYPFHQQQTIFQPADTVHTHKRRHLCWHGGIGGIIKWTQLRVIWTKGQLDYIEGLGWVPMHCKMEKKGVDPMNISQGNP